MIEKICIYLTNKIREKTPDMDDEKAEVVNFGLQLIVGEIPKIFLLYTLQATGRIKESSWLAITDRLIYIFIALIYIK